MQHERYVGYEIKALSNLLRRRLWGPADHPQSMLTEIEGVLIGYLCHSQGREIYQKDLERALCIRSSTASRLLKRLEDEGLVQRSMGVRDARMKRITPTLRAQALNQEAERRIAATEATLTRGISQEEIDQFLAIAEKLKQNLIPPAQQRHKEVFYEEKKEPGQLYSGVLASHHPDAHLRHRRSGV